MIYYVKNIVIHGLHKYIYLHTHTVDLQIPLSKDVKSVRFTFLKFWLEYRNVNETGRHHYNIQRVVRGASTKSKVLSKY